MLARALQDARNTLHAGPLSVDDFSFQRNGYVEESPLSGAIVKVIDRVEVDIGSNLTDNLVSEMTTGRNHIAAVDNGTTVTTLARDGTLHTSGTIRTANDAQVSGTLEVSGVARFYGDLTVSGRLQPAKMTVPGLGETIDGSMYFSGDRLFIYRDPPGSWYFVELEPYTP
jgi:hypothetical protein